MNLGKTLSLDIGKSNIHIVVGSGKGNIVEIENWYTIITPDGAIKDGAIVDRSAISFAISNLIKEQKIKAKRAIITVKSTAVITREITVPNVSEKDLTPLVNLDMEQYVPNISKDYRTGITVLEKLNGNGGLLKVRVFAMANTMAESYAALLKDCNLKPVALDVHANAVNKLVQQAYAITQGKPEQWNWKTAAVIDLGSELTELSIVNADKLLFNRQIMYGSNYLDNELMRQLNIQDTVLNRKKQDWADLYRTDFEQEDAKRFNDILRLYVSRVTNEVQTVIQFYSGRVVEKRPEVIYIYGGNAQLRGITDYMEKTLGIPVKLLENIPSIHFAGNVTSLNQVEFVNACAALIRAEGRR